MDPKKQRIKNIAVYSIIAILGLLFIYFIFKPDSSNATPTRGVNDSVPQADTEELPDNKLKAYDLLSGVEEQSDLQNEIDGENLSLDGALVIEPDWDKEASEDFITPATARQMGTEFRSHLQHSREKDLQEEVNYLRERLMAKEEEHSRPSSAVSSSSSLASEQMTLELLKHQPQMPVSRDTVYVNAPEQVGKLPKVKAHRLQKKVISSLNAEGLFPSENHFYDGGLEKKERTNRNTISAVVDKTVILKDGDFLHLLLKDPIYLDGMTMPRNSTIVAKATVRGTRMQLLVNSIEYEGRIVSVNLTAYDMDGQEGVNIPSTVEREALKEAGAEMGGSVGNNFTFSSSAKDQIIAEAARTTMQGAAKYLQKKISAVRVRLKAGYRLFLIDTEQLK